MEVTNYVPTGMTLQVQACANGRERAKELGLSKFPFILWSDLELPPRFRSAHFSLNEVGFAICCDQSTGKRKAQILLL